VMATERGRAPGKDRLALKRDRRAPHARKTVSREPIQFQDPRGDGKVGTQRRGSGCDFGEKDGRAQSADH
jgi:hypothetical protein